MSIDFSSGMADMMPQIEPLIAQCVAGDQNAYTALYEQFASKLYRLCYSLLLNTQDAEDVVQDSFVYAFKNLKRYDASKAAFKTWLYTIAVSRCRNVHRRKTPWLLDLTQLLGGELHAPAHESPEAAMTRRDAHQAVQTALASLSPRLREALVLRYGHDLTYREMAEVIGCPPKTAESRVRLAHEKLRHVLQPVGASLLEELLRI